MRWPSFQEARLRSANMKVLSYTSKYKNLQVEGGLACEWFEKKAEYKLSPESPPISWHANGLLVLKRQSDGSWESGDEFSYKLGQACDWRECLRRNRGRVNQDDHDSSVGKLLRAKAEFNPPPNQHAGSASRSEHTQGQEMPRESARFS